MSLACDRCRAQLDAFIDGQLSPEARLAARGHLGNCYRCAAEFETLRYASESTRVTMRRLRVPALLSRRLRQRVGGLAPRWGSLHLSRWRGILRWFALSAALLIGGALFVWRHGDQERSLAQEVVSSHIRSLMPGHIIDYATHESGAVQAWFAGRVDVAPTVPRLSDAGFSLVGGRLDYIAGRRVAVLVYAEGQHVVSVYSWRASSRRRLEPKGEVARGYHLLHWQRDGAFTCVVTDMDPSVLRSFAEGLRSE